MFIDAQTLRRAINWKRGVLYDLENYVTFNDAQKQVIKEFLQGTLDVLQASSSSFSLINESIISFMVCNPILSIEENKEALFFALTCLRQIGFDNFEIIGLEPPAEIINPPDGNVIYFSLHIP